jgi:dTDP-4-dehydrorhamnose 3,5-epimerase
MNVLEIALPGVVIMEPAVYGDERGFFIETWNGKCYERLGILNGFVQDNLSYSTGGVLRGLRYCGPKSLPLW